MGCGGSKENKDEGGVTIEKPTYNDSYIRSRSSSNFSRALLKVVLLGDSGVGKSSIMNQYVHEKFTADYKATIGADFLTKHLLVDERAVTLQIWDTAGQERFQSLGVAFYRGADCCALVFDVNQDKTFESINTWKEEFLIKAAVDNAESFPFIVLGNKIDLEGKREVSKKKALKYCEDNGALEFFEVSAKQGVGVSEAFTSLARRALRRSMQEDNYSGVR